MHSACQVDAYGAEQISYDETGAFFGMTWLEDAGQAIAPGAIEQ